jgi:sulfite reductase beta subunit-like hemoprotein
VSKVSKQEEIKKRKDGLAVWDDILRYSELGYSAITDEDFYLMRWYGIYQQVPKAGHFMMRIKIPGGIYNSQQLRAIAKITQERARGIADVTTRQTFQWHWLTVEDFPAIVEELKRVGISPVGACGDIARNVVDCAVAGLNPDEILDTRPATKAIHDYFLGNPDYSNLPRKYKLSVCGCREQCVQPEIHCFSLVGAVDERTGEAGFGLRVGGGLSTQPHFGQWLDMFFSQEQALDAAIAVTKLYRDEGFRERRTHARLKFLVADWGAERIREKLVEYLGYDPRRGVEDREPANVYRDHVGVHAQKQPGLSWIGLTVLTGRVSDAQLVALADIADSYGSGEIRNTHLQNILVPNIKNERLEEAKAALKAAGFAWEGHPVRRGAIACTGSEFCNLAITETKQRMIQIVTHLESRVAFDRNIRINMNGCPNGCAQHAVGDIGLQGCKARIASGEQVEAYDIHLGGRLGKNRSFTHAIHRKVPADLVAPAIENLLTAFNASAQPGEEFNQFVQRHTNEELDGFLGVESIVGAPELPQPKSVEV